MIFATYSIPDTRRTKQHGIGQCTQQRGKSRSLPPPPRLLEMTGRSQRGCIRSAKGRSKCFLFVFCISLISSFLERIGLD